MIHLLVEGLSDFFELESKSIICSPLFKLALLPQQRLVVQPVDPPVVQNLPPGELPPPPGVRAVPPGPGTSHELVAVVGVVPHDVERPVRGGQPLADSRLLSRRRLGVQVSGGHDGHLGKIKEKNKRLVLVSRSHHSFST